jgi:hypothetical protein
MQPVAAITFDKLFDFAFTFPKTWTYDGNLLISLKTNTLMPLVAATEGPESCTHKNTCYIYIAGLNNSISKE